MAVGGGAVVGALRVVLGADTVQFERGLTRAEQRAERFGRGIGIAIAAVASAAAAAGTALVLAVRGTINEADKLGKMAQSIGVPVEELSKLKHAADLSGVSLEGLAKGIGRLNRNLVESAQGLQTPTRAFNALGIEIRNTDGSLKTISDILPELAGKFVTLRDGPEKTAFAMQLLGRAGADMIPLLNAGEAGLRAMMEEAEALGLVIDTNTAKSAEAFNDNLTRLRRVFDGIVIRITASLLPALKNLSEIFVATAKSGDTMKIISDTIKAALRLLSREVASTVLFFQRLAAEWQALREFMKTDIFSGQVSENWAKFRAEGDKTSEMFANLGTTIDNIFGATEATIEDTASKATMAADVFVAATDKVTAAERKAAKETLSRLSQTTLAYDRMVQQIEAVGQTVQSSFMSAFDSLVEGTFNAREAVAGLLKDLGRLAINNVFQSLIGGVTGRLTGQLVSPNIPMFATGGSFTVGGAGGIDSQLVQLMATPGERVTVDRGNGNGEGNVRIAVEAVPNAYFDVRVTEIARGEARQATTAGITGAKRAESRQQRLDQ
jgi:hypothetical protein